MKRWASPAMSLAVLVCLAAPARAQDDPEPEGAPEPGSTSTEEPDQGPVMMDPGKAMDGVSKSRGEEFGNRAYGFCHDGEYEPRFDRTRYCEILDESSQTVCPQARAMCRDKKSSWEWPDIRIPEWLAWTILGIGLAACLLYVGRELVRAGLIGRGEKPDLGESEAIFENLEAIQSLPEAPSMTILRRARQALDEGRETEAALLAQLAMLRYLDDTGLARFHPSRTNGDYLRSIRRNKPLHAVFKGIALQMERVRYGDGRIDRDALVQDIGRAEALVARPAAPEAAAPVAGVILALIVSSLSNGGCEGSRKPFYSHEPAGLAAYPALLRAAGINVDISRKSFAELPPDTGLVVLTTGSMLMSGAKDVKLDDLLDKDIPIFVLDDIAESQRHFSTTATGELFNSGMSEAGLVDELFCGLDFGLVAEHLGEARAKVPQGRRLAPRSEAFTASVSAHKLVSRPLVVRAGTEDDDSPSGFALGLDRSDSPQGCILLFSSADLFTNASLTREANAQLVVGLTAGLLEVGKRVVLLDTFDGTGRAGSEVTRTMGEAKLLPLVAQGFLVVIVLFFALGAAFGPLRDPVVVEHKAFVEHVEAVGRHYARAGTAGLARAGRALARLVVMRYRHQVRGGADSGWDAMARHLAEKNGLDESAVRQAIRLGIESKDASAFSDTTAGSEEMLRTVSSLLGTRQAAAGQPQRKTKRRR